MFTTRTRQVACAGVAAARARRPAHPARVLAVAAALAIAGPACDSPRRLRLVRIAPAIDPDCGAPDGALTLHVSARGEFPDGAGTQQVFLVEDVEDAAELAIDDFPLATRSIEVEVRGVGGVVLALGKTGPIRLDELAGGVGGPDIPVMMAPPGGACAVDPPGFPRARPLVARSGADVLVAGGVGPNGAPVAALERYRPDTGAFERLPDVLYGTGPLGLVGASITALDDGRVVIAGGAGEAYQVWDPDARAFGPALFLGERRAHHAAAALPDGRVWLAGGCGELDAAGECAPGSALESSVVLDVDAGALRPGPALAGPRLGGIAGYEGAGRAVLAGGVDEAGDPVTYAERLDVRDPDMPESGGGGGPGQPGEQLAGASGDSAAPLATGGVVVGLGEDEQGARRRAFAIPPAGISSAVGPVGSLDAPLPRAGGTLTALEDGRVLLVGGAIDPVDAALLVYQPILGGFRSLAEAGGAGQAGLAAVVRRRDHAAVRLPDGSVLVVGGRDPDTGEVVADAWVIRPALTGPFTAQLSIPFAESELARVQAAIPRNPAFAGQRSEPAGRTYALESSADQRVLPSEWAVFAGPRFRTARIVATARADVGLALLFGFEGPDRHFVVSLVANQPAGMFRVADRAVVPIESCDGALVRADALRPGGGAQQVELVLAPAGEQVRVTAALGGEEVLSCPPIDAPAGLVGIGVVGLRGDLLRVDGFAATR